MHSILKRQLKKNCLNNELESNLSFKAFVQLIDKTYSDFDDDRKMLENTVDIAIIEMRELNQKIKTTSTKQVSDSEAKYNRLAENVKHHYFFYTYNINYEVTYVSESVHDMLGYELDFFMNNYMNCLTDNPINSKIESHMTKSLEGEKQEPYEIHIYHNNGEKRYLEMTEIPHFDENGNVIDIEGIARDITSYYDNAKKLKYIATHDELTNLPNRMSLYSRLDNFIDNAKREKSKFALLFIDLDNFKNINDTLGHYVGDELLKEVTKRVLPSIRINDTFARLGGDEFIIVMKITNNNLIRTINKISKLFHFEWQTSKQSLNISASIGVSIYPEDADDKDTLIKNADIAMYRAKKNGRDDFCFFTNKINQEVQEYIHMEKDLRYALAHNEFELYYQAKVSTKTKKIIGAEALIRWNHHSKGLIYPDKFIPIAEKNGFIVEIGNFVIEQGCKDIQYLKNMGINDLSISLNIAMKQLENNVVSILEQNIAKYNIDTSYLCVEITETMMIKDEHIVYKQLKLIQDMGIHIAIDDFGIGYSSLSYLHKLPLDIIKIDKSFVDTISKNKEVILLDTIIAMSKALKLNIIAEGVENELQYDYLKNIGCEAIQGFLFSKAIKLQEFLNLILKNK